MDLKEIVKDFINEFIEQIKSIKTEGIKKQIPNILTFSRALAPVIVIPTILMDKLYLVIIELTIFAITDFLDGKLARKYDCVSPFGRKLDAFCDKLFAMSLVIPATFKFHILLFNLIMEIAISYVNLMSLAKGNEPRSTIIGKIKTAILSITLILIYIPDVNFKILFYFSIVTLILQAIALISYKSIDMDKDKKKKLKNKVK